MNFAVNSTKENRKEFCRTPFQLQNSIMKYLSYIIALVLLFTWAIAFFNYGIGGIAHILLIAGIVMISIRSVKGVY